MNPLSGFGFGLSETTYPMLPKLRELHFIRANFNDVPGPTVSLHS
jgi:hypothetical protein